MNDERKNRIRESFGRSKMMQLFGAVIQTIAPGYIEIAVEKQDFMARPAGMFNGSIIATLVDVSSGYAAAAAQPVDGYFTTVELKINYLNPALGERLVARAQVIKNGKVLVVVRTDVYVPGPDAERLAATSLVTLMHLKPRPAAGQPA